MGGNRYYSLHVLLIGCAGRELHGEFDDRLTMGGLPNARKRAQQTNTFLGSRSE